MQLKFVRSIAIIIYCFDITYTILYIHSAVTSNNDVFKYLLNRMTKL